MPDRVLNETELVVLVPAYEVLGVPNALLPAGLIPYDELTAAALNHYRVIDSSADSGAGGGGNVTCAIHSEGFTLGLTDSEEDDEKTLCDPANAVDLTDFNFDAELVGFRDADLTATGVFNLWRDLTFGPDAPFLIIHRVGLPTTTAFAAGQVISIYYAFTDNQTQSYADGETLKIGQVFVPKNVVIWNHELTA